MGSTSLNVASSVPAAIIIIIATIAFLRFVYVFPAFKIRSELLRLEKRRRKKKAAGHVVIVLGSGGHTAEMLDMLSKLRPELYPYRTYIVQHGDHLSVFKAEVFERILEATISHSPTYGNLKGNTCVGDKHYTIVKVPRARNIHQSLLTTPFSALQSFFKCVLVLLRRPPPNTIQYRSTPDIILTNGPATGVMVVIAAFFLLFFGLQGDGAMNSIYVESWARVKTLSLSGKILLYTGLTNRFFVQWPGLASGRAEYRGPLVH